MLKSVGFGVLAACFAINLGAAPGELSPVGLWKMVDDKTGKQRGVVRIYETDGELFGKIESAVDPATAAQICDLCPGDRKNKPVIGLVIMRHMKKQDTEYAGGDIVDPDTGWVYRCKLKLADKGAKLELRGYIGFSLLGRTQTWWRQ